MTKISKSVLCCVFMAFVCTLALEAQNNAGKEVIIIEKVKDEDGNIISKKIIRSSDGNLSDEEIEKELNSAPSENPFGEMFQNFNFDNFNLDNFGLEGFGMPNSQMSGKPTLGLTLNFDNSEAVIEKVVFGSGAAEAELRTGDIIVSINGLVVNSIDDIKEVIDKKGKGDKVNLSIIRDGQTFEKDVELKLNSFQSMFDNIDPNVMQGFGDMFNFGNGEMPFDMDSLMQQFGSGMGERGSMPFEFEMPNYSDRVVEEGRPSLGIFIDETDAGIIITDVISDSAADKANLKANDKIIKIDGNNIETYDQLSKIIRAAGKNTKVLITYERNGKKKDAEVVLN